MRYVNKKTGVVALYESTSYYDPETKQSRPKRKYLGTEDPETGELIPSSGRRGRKKNTEGTTPSKMLFGTLYGGIFVKLFSGILFFLEYIRQIIFRDFGKLNNSHVCIG